MNRYILVFLLFVVGLSVYAKDIDIKTGMWEWSATMQMQGVSFKMPPTKYTSCITKEDLIPKQSNQLEQCRILKNKIVNNTVEWSIECNNEAGKSTSEGKIVYTKTTAKGEIFVKSHGMTMVSKITGKRIGSCK